MLKSRFRIQYANCISRLVPSAPYLAILGFQASADFEEHAWKWEHVFSIAEECAAPSNVHFLRNSSFYSGKTNVAIVGDPNSITFWKNQGALVCAITPTLPPAHLIQPPVRLWIHGLDLSKTGVLYKSIGQSGNTMHRIINRIPIVGNMNGRDVWMEFPTMLPQEAEAAAKMDQTLLHSATYLEDSDIF